MVAIEGQWLVQRFEEEVGVIYSSPRVDPRGEISLRELPSRYRHVNKVVCDVMSDLPPSSELCFGHLACDSQEDY